MKVYILDCPLVSYNGDVHNSIQADTTHIVMDDHTVIDDVSSNTLEDQ